VEIVEIEVTVAIVAIVEIEGIEVAIVEIEVEIVDIVEIEVEIVEIEKIIGMANLTVKDSEEADMDVTEKLRKVRMVMQAVRKKVAYVKSPTKWKKSKSKVDSQHPTATFRAYQQKGTIARDNFVLD